MKIGLVLERFDPVRGGLENWTWQFARCLVRLGHEVHVVAFEFHPETENDGVIPHRLGQMPRSRLDRAAAIAAELQALKFDIVHDMGIGWAADIIQPHAGSTKALWEHNLMRIPKWRQIRFWREKRYRELEEIEQRQLANPKTIIVAVSRMLAGNFESFHHLPATRIRVIHNGVDVDRFTPANRGIYREQTRRELGIGEDEILFLTLAHNLLLKNADTAIRATASVVEKGHAIRLVVAGGKKPERFMKLVRKLKLSERVTFLGQVEAGRFYAAADALLHPTWYDPCSLVTLEASSSGLPVITTRFNGAAELMRDGSEGFVVDDPADKNAVAERMKQLLDPELRQAMGSAGREMAVRNTFEQQTARFVELYRQILDGR